MSAVSRKARPKTGTSAGPAPAAKPSAGPQAVSAARPGAFHRAGPAFSLGVPVQAKVAIGEPGDAYEREADAAAEQVVRGERVQRISALPDEGLSQASRKPATEDESLQRQAEDEKPVQRETRKQDEPEEIVQRETAKDEKPVQRKTAADEKPVQAKSVGDDGPVQELAVQRKPAADEEPVQAKSTGDEEPVHTLRRKEDEEACPHCQREAAAPAAPAAAVTPAMAGAAQQAISHAGPGVPLYGATRSTLERGFGVDLGEVRVHSNARDRQASSAIDARAFTHGNHIWLGPGESETDVHLMAHETTHVLQQDAVVRRKPREEGAAGGGGAGTVPAAGGPGPAAAAAPAPAPAAGGAGAPAPVPAATAGPPAAGGGPELLMPEPPAGLSAADQERLATAENQAGAAASATEAMPAPGETVAESRAAVQEPEAETAARAAGELTATLGERAAPSPEIEDLCDRIRTLIHNRIPPDEESLVRFDPQAAAQSAGNELNSSVQGDAQRVQGEYDGLQQEPQGAPQQEGQPLETPAEQVETPAVDAAQAVPDAVPAENVSLDADVAAQQQGIEDAGMATEPAALIQDPDNPVVQAREAQGDLGEVAQRAPAEVLAEQTAVREQARGAMQGLQQQALEALQSSRRATAGDVAGGMVNLGTTEEEMRTNAGNEARRIFTEAQTQVTNLLNPLPDTAMRRWETGIQVLSTRVEQQSTEFNNWKRERYAGVGGTALEVVEYFTGLPQWAIDWLNGIEVSFGNDVCDLIREISSEVNTVIATCEEIIDNANRQIAELFARLPASLQDWAAGQQAGFAEQLEGLRNRAHSARDNFNRQMTQQAAESVQQVRESIHAMRQEAQGLIGQIADAIDRFAEDPAKFIINGLLKLVGIQPAAFWSLVDRIGQVINDIADDPLNFANNLATALGQGFQRFFDNFGTHILSGFFEWLFSGLGAVGVQIPSDFSLSSLITFFLQLMGITWARIREILARHIGEQNVALLEQAYELIATLMERGVDGIFEMIREQLNPRTILDAVLSAAVDFLIEALIRAVTPRVIALFNPAGAIAQAIEVIYRILAWVFENAARIFSLVETIVNGAAQLIAGNTGGMATAVEGALARLIAPVIDFLAGFLGLGSLPDRIADTIRGFQEMVLGVIDEVVGFLAERARGLLRALGLGGQNEAAEEDAEDLDFSDHASVANRAKTELESAHESPESYEHLRSAKMAQARRIEESYSARLEEGIALRVIFATESSDQGDRDIDFEVRIAPNTTTVTGEVDVPEDTIDVLTIFAEARSLGRPEPSPEDETPVTRLNPVSVRHGRQQIVEVFSSVNNIPAADADRAVTIIDQLFARALEETKARDIEMRFRSISGIANGLLRAAQSGTTINAHHSQTVEANPGTFPETRAERMYIPADIRRQIEAWLQANPGITREDERYRFIVSTVRDQLFEQAHPNLEAPLQWIDLIITTSVRHTALHRITG